MKRAEEMRAVFARFENSEQTLKAFAAREGISYTTILYWRRRLRDGANEKGPGRKAQESVVLTPVHVVSDPASVDCRSERFQVWLANGVSLEVPSGFEEGELQRLVGVLSTC